MITHKINTKILALGMTGIASLGLVSCSGDNEDSVDTKTSPSSSSTEYSEDNFPREGVDESEPEDEYYELGDNDRTSSKDLNDAPRTNGIPLSTVVQHYRFRQTPVDISNEILSDSERSIIDGEPMDNPGEWMVVTHCPYIDESAASEVGVIPKSVYQDRGYSKSTEELRDNDWIEYLSCVIPESEVNPEEL